MRITLLIFALFTGTNLAYAQAGDLSDEARAELAAHEQKLLDLSYTMHTDSATDYRFQACNLLIKGLVEALKVENSYRYAFDSLRGVVIKESPDRKFRVFSWELHVDGDNYRHYGAIQFNSSDLKLLPLIDRGDALRENPENASMTNENWYGYVVYDIIPAGRYEGRPFYFVFGFDRYGRWRRQKILDVLTFDAAGKATFGLPIFKTYNDEGLLIPDRQRLIMNYGAEGSLVLEFDPQGNRVVYENTVMIPGTRGEGPVNMPDGSYRSLELDDAGMWVENVKLFTHKYEEAPIEAAKPESGRDLFGRPKN